MGFSDKPAAAGRSVKLRYFAWVREKVGRSEETVVVPDDVATVRDLVHWLTARGSEFQDAFRRPEVVRAAVDQAHVKLDQSLKGASEVAFFPPVTGG